MPTTPSANGSLLDTRSLAREDILSLFHRADRLGAFAREHGNFFDPARPLPAKTIALIFFEPSTRTRISFQMAALRLGYRAISIESQGLSLVKGETYEDTVLNIAAMKPDKIVIRYGLDRDLDRLLPNLPIPVVNAGSGAFAHPTQGLLDAYTILKERGRLEGERVLLVGDLRHSRVARSNFDILKKLGCEVAVCGPPDFLPETQEIRERGLKVVEDLDQGVSWATVYMGLRIQLERHGDTHESLASYRDEYHARYGLTRERLARLAKDAIILHPGPINHGVEFAKDVVHDPRARIMKQVENGVLIRAAWLEEPEVERSN